FCLQVEDGIRYRNVTGVQTCALPIFLLESSFQHDTKGNYSFIGANPYAEITGVDNKTTFTDFKTNTTTHYDMNVLDYFKMHFPKQNNNLPLPFTGGAIGYTA